MARSMRAAMLRDISVMAVSSLLCTSGDEEEEEERSWCLTACSACSAPVMAAPQMRSRKTARSCPARVCAALCAHEARAAHVALPKRLHVPP